MTTKYEKNVINPILKVIEKKQDYLCKPENLPQLAKLGFMFNTLWYSGRVAYGYDGIVTKRGSSCENNPKYEIGDNIKYNSEENENFVYDAWGMHVSNDNMSFSYDDFKKIVLEGKELSDFEIEYRKPNKTFDDWVKVLTDKRFKYSRMYPDRTSVADHLLCTIGNGYGYNPKTGMVIREASGADQDQDLYGEWENAVLEPSILVVVNKILEVPECKIALDAHFNYMKEIEEKRKKEKREERSEFFGRLLPTINAKRAENGLEPVTLDDEDFYDLLNEHLEEMLQTKVTEKLSHREYYPISTSFSIITMFDENTHPSYIQAGIEICEDILKNPPQPRPDFNQYQIDQNDFQTKFAKDFLKKWKPPVESFGIGQTFIF